MGIILYELLIGHTPFDGGNHIQLLRNIERHEVHIPLSERSKLSPHSIALIYQLLKRNPIERISFEVCSIAPSSQVAKTLSNTSLLPVLVKQAHKVRFT